MDEMLTVIWTSVNAGELTELTQTEPISVCLFDDMGFGAV